VHCNIKLPESVPPLSSAEPWTIRKLLPSEAAEVLAHMLRLNLDERRSRFFAGMGDVAIIAHCDTIFAAGGIILGAFNQGVLRGIGELHRLDLAWNRSAEVAFSVEGPFQGCGIGTELLRRLIEVARNRAIRTVHCHCLVGNVAARRIAGGAGGALRCADGVISAQILQAWPSFWSLLSEALADARAMWEQKSNLSTNGRGHFSCGFLCPRRSPPASPPPAEKT
jgi:GNAT superfamily N-acetyltransferase